MQDTEWEDVVVGNTQSVVDGYTGNIDLASRPVYVNDDGSVSTEVSMSFNDNGKEILVPTIRTENGKRIDMTPQEAIAWYDQSGEHLGIFDSREEAEAMAQKIHSRFDSKIADTEWEDVEPVTQSVMDDRDGKIYNVPLAMDAIDTRFAIDTQHKGADKGSFFGKLDLDANALRDFQVKAVNFAAEKSKSAIRGAVGVVESATDTLFSEFSGLREEQYQAEHGYSRYPSLFFGSDETQEEIKAKSAETVKKLEDIRKRNKDWWNTVKEGVKKEEEMDEMDKVFEGLGSGIASVATSVGTSLALRNPAVASGIMATMFGEMRKNELIDKSLEQGVDFDRAEMIGTGGGLLEAALEFAGGLFMSRFAKLKPIMEARDRVLSSAVVKAAQNKIGQQALKKMATRHTDSVIGAALKGAGVEGFQEGSQTGLGMVYENLTGISNYSSEDIIGNTLLSSVIGGITGGVPASVGTAVNNKIIRSTNNSIKEFLKQDAPSLNNEELQVMADSIQEMLYQESTTYIGELNNVLEKEKSPEVLDEGLTPEQLTAETRKLLKEKYKMSDDQINSTIKAALSVIDARGQFNEAYSVFFQGLTEQGGRSDALADAEARILAARALASARAEGTQVKDVMDRWNLQFKKTAWNEGDVDNALFQFGGPGAKTAALDELEKAKQFEIDGLDSEAIRKQTGWFKGADNKWRFEISDKDAQVVLLDAFRSVLKAEISNAHKEEDRVDLEDKEKKLNEENLYETIDSIRKSKYSFSLEDVLKHDKLYKAYPILRNIPVTFVRAGDNVGASVAFYGDTVDSAVIEVNLTSKHFNYSRLRTALVHEAQHLIQKIEGFARGGSSNEYKAYVADLKSDYKQFVIKLFTDAVYKGLGVKVSRLHAIKMMEDVLEGDTENKSYIYKENNIDRSELVNLMSGKMQELADKERKYKDKLTEKMAADPFEYYTRLYGEVEARNTEARMDMTDEQRKKVSPEETQDVENADAIVVFDDGTRVIYNNNERMYFQGSAKTTHVVKPYTDRKNPSRLLHRQDENMLPEEKRAWDAYFAGRADADRIKANLERFKGTPWERMAREQVFAHQAVNMILKGQEPDFESAVDTVSYGAKVTSDIESIVNILRNRVLSGGTGLKTVHSVNSSFLNCNPTPGCAKYCYAASALLGRNKNWLKPVLIDTLAENRPDVLAKMIVDEFKITALGVAGNKAIRLFDEGDGAPHWMNVVREINNLGYRVAIFTKRKEFAYQVIDHDNKVYGDAFNLVMFSSDASNFKELEGDNKIPVAFVYSDESEIPMIQKMAANGQIRVILPIKYKGGKGIANETLQALFKEVPEARPHVCPIDAGFKKIDPRVYVKDGDVKLADAQSKGWNCAFCDRKGGVGCYYGFSTEKMNKMIKQAKKLKKTEEADTIEQFRNLFTLIEDLKQGGFINDRRYEEAGIIVRQDKQSDNGDLQDVATHETGRRGDLGWLVRILNKRLSDVSGAVKRVSETDVSRRSGEETGNGYGSSEGNSGHDEILRDDGRGSSSGNTGKSRVNEPLYQSATSQGVNLEISLERQNEIIDLANRQAESNVGENLRDEDFDYWVEEKFRKEEEERIANFTLENAEGLFGTLEDVNEEISDDPDSNQYDRSEPFTEEEFIQYAREVTSESIDDSVNSTISSLDSREWDNLREEYSSGADRDDFFDDYQELVSNIMTDNGFYVSENSSSISDSRYIDVYESEEAYDNGEEPFSKIRISDHDTHKFYGHHINLYTNKDIQEEIAKLERAFASGDFGVDSTVWQNGANSPRGAYQNNIIYLFENADASTVIHELGHFFLDDMQKFSDNKTTKEQLEAIYKFVGSTDGKLTVEQHEYFANAFEVYLMEGRAPNKTLESVFTRFRKWLSRMWNEVKRLSGVKVTPDIRKVFDQMLGGRGLDFAMQMSGVRMKESLESGVIPDHIIDRTIRLIEEGKMSRADMNDLLERLKTGELKRKDYAQELKKFETSNVKHNEALNPFDKVRYREALARGNFNKKDVVEKIHRLLKWSEPRSQNGKLVGRFASLEMNQKFAHIRELMNMDKAQAKEKIAENIDLINRIIKGEEVGDTEAIAFDNRVLSIVTNKAKAETIIDVYTAISDSYNLGRLTTAVTGEAKKARRKRLIQETKDVLTNDGTINWRKEQSKLKQFANQFGISQMSWQGILDILSMNDKSSKTGNSRLSRELDVFDAQQKEAQGVADDGEKASKFMEKNLKGAGNAAISVSRYVNSKLGEKFTIEWDGNKKTFTKDQLIDIYMKSKDPETKKMMAEDKILQFNDNFLFEVNQLLTSEDRAVAKALFEFYEDNHAKINAFYEDKYGISLPKRPFYSPRSMDRGGINVDTGDLSSYAGFSGVKERKAKGGAIKAKGAFQVLQDYIVNSNHWIAWSDKLIDINAVMGDVEVKNMIRNMFGNKIEGRIAYEISRMASNDKFQSKYFNFDLLNKVRSNYAVSVLGLKPSLAIKQLTSFPAYLEHMSVNEFMSGLADFATHMKEAVETLGNTTLMKTRDVNIIKDFEELSRSELFKSGSTKVKLREFMMANIKLGDRGAIYMGGWALYKAELKKNLARGMDAEKAKALALEKFERVTDETQQSGRLSQQSYWQSNPFLRMFTMFQSSQNQYLRKEINAVRGWATGRMDKKQAAKTLFIFHILLPCLFQYASDGFEFDEKAQLRAALLGSLNGIFVLNGILERGLDVVMGTADAWRATSMAVSDVVPFWGSAEDLYKFFVELAEGDVDLEDYLEVVRSFAKPAGELTGIPVKYPLDVLQNFGSYAEDDEISKEVLLWLGWSPYALRDKDED
jgi:hypothetical protein